MTDLWTEASLDHEAIAREAALDRAQAEFETIFPFLAASKSAPEYRHRKALAADRLVSIALRNGLDPSELDAMADRHMNLLFEATSKTALPEGTDPVASTVQSATPQGSGPEKPDAHTEQTDWSGHYSEIPTGPPAGPPPQVVTPDFTGPQQVSEVTAAKGACACGSPLTGKGKCKACGKKQAKCDCLPDEPVSKKGSLQRTADASMPAGVGGGAMTPDGLAPGGAMPPPPAAPSAPPGAGLGGMNVSQGDPYNIQVSSVARSVLASNPQLPMSEARRVARRVVGSYLRQADLNSSVISDDYGSGSSSTPRGQSGGGGSGMLTHMLEGQGLKSMLPGGGAAGAADAGAAGGAAAGGAADLAELAPLLLA